MTYAVVFEKWQGKTILNLRSIVDAIYDAYVPIAATDDGGARTLNLYLIQFEPREHNRGQVEASENI